MPLQAKCPICRKVTEQGDNFFPFCGERCQRIDLGNWSSEEYRIPGASVHHGKEEEDDETRSR
ncbi:MAG: DNA gyrase inhibitor YacG [Acidobacteria bacterium]|nr:DNA gyrase inhibitor YacG [Acidobacteriota bacterium]